jgi:hypothetical protein
MATYTYRCPVHGQMEIRKPMAEAGTQEWCPQCLGRRRGLLAAIWEGENDPMRRVYDQQRRAIVRPRGYNLRPGERDPTVPGLSYSNFAHELARGELTEDATPVYTPEGRARREAELAAEDERPPAMAEIDRGIPERAHQELHEWARAAYSQLEEERRYA